MASAAGRPGSPNAAGSGSGAAPVAAPAASPLRPPHPPPPRPRPVMLLLVGIPGSGKSKFAQALVQRGRAAGAPCRWVAVNQDTAAKGGKRGTRQQCLTAAAAALTAGSSVIIDRCGRC
jgi:hypothetical protein